MIEAYGSIGENNLGKKTTERIKYLDVLRGIGIVYMIMGHVGFGYYFDYYIHSFHMPIFFIVSGFFYNRLSYKQFFKKRIKSLLIPYITLGSLFLILWIIISDDFEINRQYFLNLLFINTNGLAISGALWFLTSLFFAEIIFNIIINKIQNKTWIYVIIIGFALLGNKFTSIFEFRLPWALDTSFVGLGLMFLGYNLNIHKEKKYIKFLFNLSNLSTIILVLVNIVLIFSNGYINMRTGSYSEIFLFWINAILSFFVYLNISKLLLKFSVLNFISDELRYIGINSIVYLCFNQITILVLIKLRIVLLRNSDLLPLSNYIILVLSLLILHITSYIMMNTKLKLLIGK